eukprot:scaffold1793_cov245-Pinguiococcus_pyrenoidosus.AAC.3
MKNYDARQTERIRRSEGTKERRSEGAKERRSEGKKERRNEGTKERRSEGTKERKGASYIIRAYTASGPKQIRTGYALRCLFLVRLGIEGREQKVQGAHLKDLHASRQVEPEVVRAVDCPGHNHRQGVQDDRDKLCQLHLREILLPWAAAPRPKQQRHKKDSRLLRERVVAIHHDVDGGVEQHPEVGVAPPGQVRGHVPCEGDGPVVVHMQEGDLLEVPSEQHEQRVEELQVFVAVVDPERVAGRLAILQRHEGV